MAFKIPSPPPQVPETPKELLDSLTRRKIQALYGYQEKLLDYYQLNVLDEKDIILQLPTGSGKTLVALLIAEWRRRKFKQKILYLCPTNQLVEQVFKQAIEYGINVVRFTGSKNTYDLNDLNKFTQAESIAITNYSSLFNINPAFSNVDTILCDDAHSADQFISPMWRLDISKTSDPDAFNAIINIIKNALSDSDKSCLNEPNANYSDVNHLPIPYLQGYVQEISTYLNTYYQEKKNNYQWLKIRDNLRACLLFYSCDMIQIKPFISPTWEHDPFVNAKQRIYISATLSLGGDLERSFGIKHFAKLSLEDYSQSGMGHHLFIFPQNLTEEDQKVLENNLIQKAGRAIYLSTSNKRSQKIQEELMELKNNGFEIITDIEKEKEKFTKSTKAIAILTNRYDGIDFPNDDCRLMFIDGKPQATNLQERFLMYRFSASSLYHERIQIRLLQALGRCTRSSNDFACVVIKDQAVYDYLADPNTQKFLDVQTQSEIDFGLHQNNELATLECYVDNFSSMKANDTAWEGVTNHIRSNASSLNQESLNGLNKLKEISRIEIDFQKKLWSGDYQAAFDKATKILGMLTEPELKGYRATWNYFSGASLWLLSSTPGSSEQSKILSKEYFREAKDIAIGVDWLIRLSNPENSNENPKSNDLVMTQVLKIQESITELGLHHDRKFTSKIETIKTQLSAPDTFEEGHKELGKLLGFNSDKVESSGSPDPWWELNRHFLVFEDHVGATNNTLGLAKIRQITTHENWIRGNSDAGQYADVPLECKTILLTSVKTLEQSILPEHTRTLETFYVWNSDDFTDWANNCVKM